MSTQEIANRLVALCREGKFEQAIQELYAPEIVSVEPVGAPVERVQGFEALAEKAKAFGEMIAETHGSSVSDPIVADNFFSCSMTMDVTFKDGPRVNMEEICLYQVKDGKVIKEEFFFTPMQG
ncbi:MAG: nuclear transport factor 2 family protein [Cytophagales bacterium]|nr:nuclear transport factor 2 family protein [Cytophagales bacterium]